ncbi:MAG: response regulator, partial [Longimicrobiales bacterium]|nr:response regulator [Longimicrobiales bacterium]
AEHDVARRLEGLLVVLRRLVGDKRDEATREYEWLAVCAGAVSPDAADVTAAWEAVQRSAGMDDAELASAVARRFGLAVAELTDPSRAAWRLVPEALMTEEGIVPVVEDSDTITVATAEPVALSTELELERLTGRRPVFVVASPTAIRSVLEGGVASSEAAPVEQASAPAPDVNDAEAAADATRAPGPVQVLVVDDEPSARLLVRSLLEKRGFEAVEAVDGLEALQKIRSHQQIGLAVVDLNMPRMDGLELMWELRDSSPWSDLPVIVITGEKD